MGYKEQILKILNGNKLTVKELAEKLNISESDIRVYIKRIKDNNMNELKVVGTDNKYKIYTLNKKEQEINPKLLQKLYSFLSNKCKIKREVDNSDIKMLEEVKEFVKKNGYIKTS